MDNKLNGFKTFLGAVLQGFCADPLRGKFVTACSLKIFMSEFHNEYILLNYHAAWETLTTVPSGFFEMRLIKYTDGKKFAR